MKQRLSAGKAAAICYADVFDFPLSREELIKFQISNFSPQINPKIRVSHLKTKGAYYFLKGREKLVALRKKRESWSHGKIALAMHTAKLLSIVPTIQMVAVTGGLAMNNCDKDDDIDFLIIAKSGTMWTTRFLSVLLLELLGKRRRPFEQSASNKICLNMFIDDSHLKVPEKEQDIFSAHEVAQIKVLWSREGTKDRLWKENRWVNKFLPHYKASNSKSQINPKLLAIKLKQKNSLILHWHLKFIWILNSGIWNLSEKILKSAQLFYMKSRRTNEVIKEGYLRFHPKDARDWIIPEFEKRLEQIGLK